MPDVTSRNYKIKMQALRRRVRKGGTLTVQQLERLREYEDASERYCQDHNMQYARVTVPAEFVAAAEGATDANEVLQERTDAGVPLGDPVTTEQAHISGAGGFNPPASDFTLPTEEAPSQSQTADVAPPPKEGPFIPPAEPEGFNTRTEAPQTPTQGPPPPAADPKVKPAAKAAPAASKAGQKITSLLSDVDADKWATGIVGAWYAMNAQMEKDLEGQKLAMCLPDAFFPLAQMVLADLIKEKADAGMDPRKLRVPLLAFGASVTMVQGFRARKIRGERAAFGPEPPVPPVAPKAQPMDQPSSGPSNGHSAPRSGPRPVNRNASKSKPGVL